MASMLHGFGLEPVPAMVVAAVLGLLSGEFLGTIVLRLPALMEREWLAQCRDARGEPALPPGPRLLRPGWCCAACGAAVRGGARVPLLGWALRRGRCGQCGAALGWRYPIIQGQTALLFAACVWRYGFTPLALCAMVLAAALLVLGWIDFDTALLPDAITLPLLWAGLLVNLNGALVSLPHAVLGAAGGYVFLWCVFHVFRAVTGRDGMGHGDFKLLAALGAWLGVAVLPWLLLAASVAGVAVSLILTLLGRARPGEPLPFGPCLAAAGMLALLATRQTP